MLTGLLALVVSLILAHDRTPVYAQTPQSSTVNRATITQVLDSAQVFIQNRRARVRDSANKGQRIRTGQARAQLTFNTGAIGRLAHNSVLTVGQCARLQRGTLLVNGAVNGCTSSILAGVRGTTYVLEASDSGTAAIKVLEGEVTVKPAPKSSASDAEPARVGTKQLKFPFPSLPPVLPEIFSPRTPLPDPTPRRNDPILKIEPLPPSSLDQILQIERSPTVQTEIVLKAGEKVSISPTGALGVIERLTQSDFTDLLTGELFSGFTLTLPGVAKIQQSFQTLFPNVPFPLQIPQIVVPPVRIPSPRLPLPF